VVRDAKARLAADEVVALRRALEDSGRTEHERHAERLVLQQELERHQAHIERLEVASGGDEVDRARAASFTLEQSEARLRSLDSLARQRIALLSAADERTDAAPPESRPATAPEPAAAPDAAPRPIRVADAVPTIILLVIGVFGAAYNALLLVMLPSVAQETHTQTAGTDSASRWSLTACTSNVYSSSGRFSYVFGEVQGSQAVPAFSPVRRHSKVLDGWSEPKVKVAVRLSFWMSGSSGA
jgi:hypothetical protein